MVATRNRADALKKALESLAEQSVHPKEIIVIDSSGNDETRKLCEPGIAGVDSHLKWIEALQIGAAVQRNQGVTTASQPFIWFFDDDILFDPDCVARLWKAISSDPQIGGVSAMIKNQNYGAPGAASRFMFRLMNGSRESTYAGRVIGPAVNLLPEDREDLPEVVPVEWLNTTCTIYRREALPDPPFPAQFTGYSLMEDVALSLEVGKTWKLANARTARIFHDSQPADYKSDDRSRSRMEVMNRWFVMTHILNRLRFADWLKFLAWQMFAVVSVAAGAKTRPKTFAMLRGQLDGYRQIASFPK